MRTLKLDEMAAFLDVELTGAAQDTIPVGEVLERLLAKEVEAFSERLIQRRIKESKLPELKLLAGSPPRHPGALAAGYSCRQFRPGTSKIIKTLLLIGCQKNFSCRHDGGSHALGAAFGLEIPQPGGWVLPHLVSEVS